MAAQLQIDLREWSNNEEAEVFIVLDPGPPCVRAIWNVGAVPGEVQFRRYMRLGVVGAVVVPDSLTKWLRAHGATLLRLAGEFRGFETDGRNRYGVWGERGQDLAEDIENEIGSALDSGEIAKRWPAAEWLEPVEDELRVRMEAGETAAQIADAEVESGQQSGAYLERSDVLRFLAGLVA